MKKVIVIGSGSSLLKAKLGALIDEFDVVIRMNDFKTEGFEDKVGKKVDILFTCTLRDRNTVEALEEFEEVIACLLMNPHDGVELGEDVLSSPKITESIDWPEAFKLRDEMGLEEPQYPSTGILCINWAVKRYGQIHIAGFDNFKTGNKHYFEAKARKKSTAHNSDAEAAFIEKLVDAGTVSILS